MSTVQPNLVARSDTMLGVCQALGEDFGISPNLLRLGFAAGVVFNVGYALLAYLAIGALVAISRLVYPARRGAAQAAPVTAQADADAPPVTVAAEPVIAAEPFVAAENVPVPALARIQDDERLLVASAA